MVRIDQVENISRQAKSDKSCAELFFENCFLSLDRIGRMLEKTHAATVLHTRKVSRMSNETTFRATALAFSTQKVVAMQKRIDESFARRDAFETEHGLNVNAVNSYTTERNRMMKNSVAVARFFLACGVEPKQVIERRITDDSVKMFNAKALKKITELARFTCGYGENLERVTRAFLASSIAATDKGNTVITNHLNRMFLTSFDMSNILTDKELSDTIAEYQHAAMSGGSPTQSSQMRNVIDVLQLGKVEHVESPRDAVSLDTNHGLIAMFREKFMK
jgi:hypothetical protein